MVAKQEFGCVQNDSEWSEARHQLDAVARALMEGDYIEALQLARMAAMQLRELEQHEGAGEQPRVRGVEL